MTNPLMKACLSAFAAGLGTRGAGVLLAGLMVALPALAAAAGPGVPDPTQLHPDGSIRVTSPGGLILHHRIPVGEDFSAPVRFQVNALGKGMNNSNLRINGEVWLADTGVPMFRGQCVEDQLVPQGKIYARKYTSTPFGGSLAHGRHTATACRGVLVQVQLPEFGR